MKITDIVRNFFRKNRQKSEVNTQITDEINYNNSLSANQSNLPADEWTPLLNNGLAPISPEIHSKINIDCHNCLFLCCFSKKQSENSDVLYTRSSNVEQQY